jgi:hypothetical protein
VSAEDPKETLKNLIKDNITLYKDDGQTKASVLVANEYVEEFWKKYEVIITVGLANDRERLIGLGGSLREVIANYQIGVWTRDQTGITGQKMRWKAIQEVTRIINDNMKNPGGILNWMKLAGCVDADRIDVKPVLYHSSLTVETHRYETV